MTDPRTQVVEHGYDAIADGFLEWRDRIVDDPCIRSWLVPMREPEGEVAFHWVLVRR